VDNTGIRPTMRHRQVRFGPVTQTVTNDQKLYNFNVKEHFSMKVGFAGRRSICPGFETLKEKPSNWNRVVKDKQDATCHSY
jgi:hypothetical protein